MKCYFHIWCWKHCFNFSFDLLEKKPNQWSHLSCLSSLNRTTERDIWCISFDLPSRMTEWSSMNGFLLKLPNNLKCTIKLFSAAVSSKKRPTLPSQWVVSVSQPCFGPVCSTQKSSIVQKMGIFMQACFLRLQKCLKNDNIIFIWKLSSGFCSPSNALSKLMFLRRFQTPLITGHAMSHSAFDFKE